MSKLAGSAIAQGPNVGRLDQWSEWKPISGALLWLLLSGATDPPIEIDISERRTRDDPGDKNGAFLAGITRDLVSMEDVVGKKLFNSVRNLFLTKKAALSHISKLFEKCKSINAHPMLYYTGHGEIGTGNWCFADGKISIDEICGLVPAGCFYPMIFSDACYSGHWANFCLNDKGSSGLTCLAACPEYSAAFDTKGEGGDLTLFMTGKKLRPSTEPMYSGGNRLEFPITGGFDEVEYEDFITSHRSILVSQFIHSSRFGGIFATSKLYSPRPATRCGRRGDYDSFIKFVDEQKSKSKTIYSLACDDNYGFGVFFMEGFSTEQILLKDSKRIKKRWDEDFMITACAARGSTYFIIMSKGTKEYHGKGQQCFFCSTWKQVESAIQDSYQDGNAITGVCYSTGLQQYFVVITELQVQQCYRWFNDTKKDDLFQENWLEEKRGKGFYPTLIFKDPTDGQVLLVVTKDENLTDFICRSNYKLSQ